MTETDSTQHNPIDFFHQVYDFNRVIRGDDGVPKEFSDDPNDRNGEEWPFEMMETSFNLVVEEFDEFKEALFYNDPVETVDALCDMLVVGHGLGMYLYKNYPYQVRRYYDVALEGVGLRDHAATETFGPLQKSHNLTFDIIQSMQERIYDSIDLIEAGTNPSNESFRYGFAQCSFWAMRLFYTYMHYRQDLNLLHNMQVVLDSNMDKFPKTQVELDDTLDFYRSKGVEVYSVPVFVNGKNVFAVKRKDGKLLKRTGWKPPQFTIHTLENVA